MALNTLEAVETLSFRVTKFEERFIKEVDDTSKYAFVLTFEEQEQTTLSNTSYEFIQTEELTELGIAVQPYGAIIMNSLAPTQDDEPDAYLFIKVDGVDTLYKSSETLGDIIGSGVGVGVTFEPESDDSGDDSGDDSIIN